MPRNAARDAERLFLKPMFKRGHLPELSALFLWPSTGLCHVKGWQQFGVMVADDPADYGIGTELADQIAQWTAAYNKFSQGVRGDWTPEHCREFDIQTHNRQGFALARAIVAALPDDRQLVFKPSKRKGAYYHSYMAEYAEHWHRLRLPPERGGQPRSSYYDDTRDPKKWVRVMGDYCSSGIWHWDGYEMAPEDLPVPPALRGRLEAWAGRYFSSYDGWRQGAPDNFAQLQEHGRLLREYSDEGLAIAKAIKQCLPDWTVVYFDDDLSDRHLIRSKFQFEIG